jgi:PGF-CTERM protein
MRYSGLIIFALALTTLPGAIAANPIDTIAAPLQENLNVNAQDIGNKAIEHIAQGNLTQEHISQDINATKEQLRKEAVDQINQGLNVTTKEVEQRAKEELQNQINQRTQLPGFEALFALLGLVGIAFALGRRN